MSEKFGDYVGSENLELMEVAVRYSAFVGQLVRKALPVDGRIVEFGSGSGSQTQHVMKPSPRLTCVEINPDLQVTLRERGYQTAASLDDIPAQSLAGLFSINCLEHIKEDEAVLAQIYGLLHSGGSLILYVPAMPTLFSAMDRLVGHERRYRRRHLIETVRRIGFGDVDAKYVDALGVLPSYLYKLRPKASGVPSALSLKVYDTFLFPLSRLVDSVTARMFGKNVFLVAIKP